MKTHIFLMIMLSVSVFAADKNWDGGGSDDSWLTPGNWDFDTLPAVDERVFLDVVGDILVESTDSVEPRKIIGPCENVAATVTLTIQGTLTNSSYWYMGTQVGGQGVLNIEGGSVYTRDLILAPGNSYSAVVNINSGVLDINGISVGTGAYFGSEPAGDATTTCSGSATVNVFGGVLNIALLNTLGSNALINITGGQMTLPGDQRTLINGYVTANKIKAYNGAGVVGVDYDTINPNMSTVFGITNLQSAIAAAVPGSTVYVQPGIYDEGQFDINKSVTLKSVEGPENTIIQVSGNGLCVIADGVMIDGFTIQNQPVSSSYLLRIGKSTDNTAYAVDDCRIQNCLFESGNQADAITIYGNTSNAKLFGNSIFECVNAVVLFDDVLGTSIIDNDIFYNSYGIRILGSADETTILSNGIFWNSILGISNTSGSIINAENNFWGTENGPYHSVMNTQGQGNSVSDSVGFLPYLAGCTNDRWQLCSLGDLTGDCQVDMADLAKLATFWLECNGLACSN